MGEIYFGLLKAAGWFGLMVVGLWVLGGLAGCSHHDADFAQRMQLYTQRCEAYGYKPGSDALATCLQTENVAYMQRAQSKQDALISHTTGVFVYH